MKMVDKLNFFIKKSAGSRSQKSLPSFKEDVFVVSQLRASKAVLAQAKA